MRKRILAIALCLVMVTAIAATTVSAQSTPASSIKESKSSNLVQSSPVQSTVPVSNAYLQISIDNSTTSGDSGRFILGTTGGDPNNPNDNNARLLYGSSPWSSFTTVRIDGVDHVYGSPSDGNYTKAPTLHATYIDSVWVCHKIEVTQTLSLVTNPATGRADVMLIQYKLRNIDGASHTAGLRILLDTELGSNDGAPFRIPGTGAVTTEHEYVGAHVTDYWQAFDNLNTPNVVAQGTLRGASATPPDRAVFANWENLYDTNWNYTINPTTSLTGDSAVALYWNPVTISAGQSVSHNTYYGISGLSSNTLPPLALSTTGPAVLSVVNGAYSPNPFTVMAYVEDLSTTSINQVNLTISLPAGLTLVGTPAKQSVGNLAANEIKSVSWSVRAASQTSAKHLNYTVTATAVTPAVTRQVTRSITVPALVAAKKITVLNATASATATVNKNFTVSGKLTVNGVGLAGQNVTLFKYNPATNAWTKLATTKTSSTGTVGTYTFTVKEGVKGTYGYQVLYLGTGTYRPASSVMRWVDVS